MIVINIFSYFVEKLDFKLWDWGFGLYSLTDEEKDNNAQEFVASLLIVNSFIGGALGRLIARIKMGRRISEPGEKIIQKYNINFYIISFALILLWVFIYCLSHDYFSLLEWIVQLQINKYLNSKSFALYFGVINVISILQRIISMLLKLVKGKQVN